MPDTESPDTGLRSRQPVTHGDVGMAPAFSLASLSQATEHAMALAALSAAQAQQQGFRIAEAATAASVAAIRSIR